MNSEIILDKNKGLLLSVSNKKSKACIKLCDGNIEFSVESLNDNRKSILKISHEEVIFDAEYINIDTKDFINNVTNEFQIRCKDNNINLSNNFYSSNNIIEFYINNIANISASKVVFS